MVSILSKGISNATTWILVASGELVQPIQIHVQLEKKEEEKIQVPAYLLKEAFS